MKIIKRLCAIFTILFAGFITNNTEISAFAASKKSTALKKKVLVVYYSRTGNTKRVAEEIAKKCDADIEQIIDKKDRSGTTGYIIGGKDAMNDNLTEIEPVKFNPSQYDIIVIGTPVWAWNMSPAIRTYITASRNSFKEIAVFTTAGGTKQDKIVLKIEALSGKTAKASTGFVKSDFSEKNRLKYDTKITTFIESLKK